MTIRWLCRLAALALALCLGACAGLPQVERPPSSARVAPDDSPLARFAAQAGVPEGRSGFWPMVQGAFALHARLELIRRAQVSLDLQYYLLANDGTGRLILRELRDAARRGVRVRLLVDDLYTEETDDLLLGLAAEPNVEVRLFNPFTYGRSSGALRVWGLMMNFKRLNHRMHNKLFVADGRFAIAGGRNLADEYFLRGRYANFVDFDMLATGAVVPQLDAIFDEYWNSPKVYPVQSVANNRLDAELQRASFEKLTDADSTPPPAPPPAEDSAGAPPLGKQIDSGLPVFIVGDGMAYADRPDKMDSSPRELEHNSVTRRSIALLREAKEGGELIIISPYFIPGKRGLEGLQEARERKVSVVIVTNAFAASDEPLVNLGYDRYRLPMLHMGVQLFEMSSSRLKHDEHLNKLLGSSTGRLHAKLALVDRRMTIVGSMNMDPRSYALNTEVAVAVRGEAITRLVAKAFRIDEGTGVYEVRLRDDGSTLQWIGRNEDGQSEDRLDAEPEAGWLQRLRLFLLSLFVPEDVL